MPAPMITIPMTMMSRSMASHWGTRFAGCLVMTWSLRDSHSVPGRAQVAVNTFTLARCGRITLLIWRARCVLRFTP
jgi:hypothetical protein